MFSPRALLACVLLWSFILPLIQAQTTEPGKPKGDPDIILISPLAPPEAIGKMPPPPGFPARKPRFKVLIIADTDDAKIGKGFKADRRMMEAVTEELEGIDLVEDRIVLDGRKATADEVVKAIRKLKIRKGDAVLCYASCHGAYADKVKVPGWDKSRGHFLALPGGSIWRATILHHLQANQPRLTVLLTDSCNVPGNFEIPKKFMTMPMNKEGSRLNHLMRSYSGIVDVNSSTWGEFSLGPSQGGIFTLALIRALHGKAEGDWSDMLKETSRDTQWLYKEVTRGRLEQKAQRPQEFQVKVEFVSR